ncbi:MAG: hypothetical protein M9954_16590, partial [Cyclobacteriaceae bacterium]|nr:hypothetical protein [Cyclobacteriaceae bacterium]
MTNENKDISVQQSLDLIQAMIKQAQGNMLNNSFYFILWGWAIVLANIGMYALYKFTDYEYPYIVWLIAIPAWAITMVYGARQGKQAGKRTHLDKVNMWLWICFGLTILPFLIFMQKIGYNINPVVLVITAAPTFLAGIMLKFKPLILGGIGFYLFGILCFMVSPVDQYIVGAIAI